MITSNFNVGYRWVYPNFKGCESQLVIGFNHCPFKLTIYGLRSVITQFFFCSNKSLHGEHRSYSEFQGDPKESFFKFALSLVNKIIFA